MLNLLKLLCGLVVLLSTGWCFSQEPVTPRLILNTKGPSAKVLSLAFSADSTRLYSAGLDKVVHVWEVGWNEDKNAPAVTYAKPLYWEIARGNRGSIYSMARSSIGDEIVIGGVSARQQDGDIVLFDLPKERIAAVLPTPAQRDKAAEEQKIGSEGHQNAVVALGFSPSCNSILSRDERGGMFLWRRQRAADQLWLPTQLKAATQQARRFAPQGIFLSDQVIAYSEADRQGNVVLRRRDFNTDRDVRYPEKYPKRIAALARDPAGEFWASADGLGNVYLTSISDSRQRHALKASLPEITAIAFGGVGLMAVVSNENIDGQLGRARVDLFDTITRKQIDSVDVSDTANVRTVAISPDGKYLATHCEQPRRTLIYRLTDPQNQLFEKPLSGMEPTTVRPHAAELMDLRLSSDGKQLAIRDSGQARDRVLDVCRGEFIVNTSKNSDWGAVVSGPARWNIRVNEARLDHLEITNPQGRRWGIRLDPTLQGTYFSHCFLYQPPDANKEHRDEPVGIAIGTDNVNGIFIYRLDSSEKVQDDVASPRLVRWFRDHTGSVISLLQSHDRAMLISASMDQTVKFWRIGDLWDASPAESGTGFNQQTFWGCDFVVENGRVVSRDMDQAGIAYSKTLRDGDIITRAQGYDRNDPQAILDAASPQQSAQKIVQTLDRLSVLDQVLIHAESKVADGPITKKAFIIRPAWQPIVTAFMNRAGEWAIWNPDGYFNASAAEGGGLFSWLINRGADQSPRIIEGGFLSKQYERPDIIEKLLAGSSLTQALAATASGSADALAATILKIPEVQILSPPLGDVIGQEKPLKITASVNFFGANPENYEVTASVDGARLGKGTPGARDGDHRTFTWITRVTGRLNQIQVIATEPGGALNSFYASDVAFRRGQIANPTPYQLHVLSLASEDYQGSITSQKGGFGRLEYSIDDVDAVTKLLEEKEQSGLGYYRIGHMRELQDDEITPETVRAEISSLNATLAKAHGPQILVIYLSGHGTTIDGEYYYVTTKTTSAESEDMKHTALPWSLLSEAGGRPASDTCRVVYMIDTCHSGSAVDAKSSIRDPLRGGGIVIAAASGREAALELAPFGHGSFTYSVLAALNGKADGSISDLTDQVPSNPESERGDADGVVDLEELVVFVGDYVQRLTGGQQKPSATPSRLMNALRIPLVNTREDRDEE